MKLDICVVGGGRVGLPFALILEHKGGFKIGVLDIDGRTVEMINGRKMPFEEPGFDDLLSDSKIHASQMIEDVDADTFVITVGTPLKQHIETDLSSVFAVIDRIIGTVGVNGKTLILRSTVAPNTTSTVRKYIEMKTNLKCGTDFFLAMCPERIAEGKAMEEFTNLPQIIGAEDQASYDRAKKIFECLSIQIFKFDTYIEAEITKLFCNIYRYINFSIPNYFLYIMDYFGIKDPHGLFERMNYKYPRNAGMAKPGFAAGTCLRKDFGMINEFFPQTDIILQSYKINEFMPKFIVDKVKDKITGTSVGVLGYSFKRDTDDPRDALSYKMISYINRNVPKAVHISDRHMGPIGTKIVDKLNEFEFDNRSEEEVMRNCDIIFIGMNHSYYYSDSLRSALMAFVNDGGIIVDIWNVLGEGNLVYGA